MVRDPFSSIEKDIRGIRKAAEARDPWAALGIPQGSGYKEIKTAQRKWIRKLHPDRWFASADERLRQDIQEAFYQVQAAYFEALKQCAIAVLGTEGPGPITPPVEQKTGALLKARMYLQQIFGSLFRQRRDPPPCSEPKPI